MWQQLLNSVKSRITRKLVLSYLLIVLLPIAAGSLIFADFSYKETKKDMLGMFDGELAELNRNVSARIDACMRASKLIKWDQTVITLLQTRQMTDSYLVTKLKIEILPKLQTIQATSGFPIHRLTIHHGNQRIFDVDNAIYYDAGVEGGAWADKLRALNPGVKLWSDGPFLEGIHEERQRYPSDKQPVRILSIYNTIYSNGFLRMLGVVELDIRESDLLAPFAAFPLKGGQALLVFDGAGALVCQSGTAPAGGWAGGLAQAERHGMVRAGGDSYFVNRTTLAAIGYEAVLLTRESELNQSGYLVLIALLTGAGLLTLGLLAYFLSRLIFGNLMKLSVATRRIGQGDFTTQVEIRSADEIGRLADSFNAMTDRINALMQNVRRLNAAEKEAIYHALENQMNPHFLCNALDMLRMTAEVRGDAQMADALALVTGYFVFNLSQKQKFVTVKEEMKNVSDFIAIHNMIRNIPIQCDISVCDGLSGYLDEHFMLKLILQPVVENAIMHGFKARFGACRIFIGLSSANGTLCITVEDNGAGMGAERLEALRRHLAAGPEGTGFPTAGNGIGLKNICERLQMNFGPAFGIDVEGQPGIGACVTVRMPLLRRGELAALAEGTGTEGAQ